MFYLQEEVQSVKESFIVAAAAPPQAAAPAVEEPVPQEVTDPVSTTEEESIPSAASPPPVTMTQEEDDPQQAEPASAEVAAPEPEVAAPEPEVAAPEPEVAAPEPEVAAIREDTLTTLEEASDPVEEDILEESIIDTNPKEPEMVQSTPAEEVTSSVEEDVQEMSQVTDAANDASDSETCITETTVEIVMATEEAPLETAATQTLAAKDVPVNTAGTIDTDEQATESAAAEEIPVCDEQETDVISFDQPPAIDTEAGALEAETSVTKEEVLETAPLVVAVEELISFDNTGSSVLDVPVPVETSTGFDLDPLMDPLDDTMPVLKPDPAQEPRGEGQSTEGTEDVQEPLMSLQAESLVLTALEAPTETNAASDGPGQDEPAEELEVDMHEEVKHFLNMWQKWAILYIIVRRHKRKLNILLL